MAVDDPVFYEGERVLGLWGPSGQSALLVTRRPVADWHEATPEEQAELTAAIARAQAAIQSRYPADGFTVQMRTGSARTTPQLQIEVIPHLAHQRLVEGQKHDPLLPLLLSDLDRASKVDIAVAFILPSGIELLRTRLADLVEQRQGRLRLVTGDYLTVTDPDALQTLLDLEGDVHLRVFETAQTGVSFHPKSYLFHDREGRATAYVGSSNLSRSALTEGVEWNYRVLDEPEGLRQAQQAFERLFAHPATVPITPDWLHHYRGRFTYAARPLAEVGMVRETPQPVPQPHAIQREALAALAATRAANHTAGLVVLATGLGKTWLAAFDSGNFRRVLFVAHRQEILNQARATFRRIRPRARLGLFTGREKATEADVLFASIQTLGKASHQQLFEPTAFDYIVVDEFHHASARTYRSLLDYFEPRFLLGLTATPERSDGGDLLALCGQNLVYRCDLHRGIHDGQLSPLAYFGVPDEVDYANIPWRNARFDPEALTSALATRARAENALTHYRSHAGQRTIAFCCSQLHSDFMADFFARAGLRAVSVHSGPTTAPRSDSLERLNRGELDILCCVDMFNEGVDLPRVDTVMMLRPTESRVLWLQQLGRGLRKSANKERLVVIDYIGNHRAFLRNVSTLLEELAGVKARSDAELRGALAELDTLSLPPGCSVTYDLSAVDVLRGLLRNTRGEQALLDYYHDFSALHGVRPTAVEAYHDGYNPRAVARTHGSWLGFVASLGALDTAVFSAHRDFLETVEKAADAPSLLVVSCALSGGRARFARVAARLGLTLDYHSLAEGWLGTKWFVREGDEVVGLGLSEVSGLVDEVADWRLAEYLDRPRLAEDSFEVPVKHNGRDPILLGLPRGKVASVPTGWTPVMVEGRLYEANFVKVAVNVMREPGGKANVLGDVLRGWFGEDAGRPGTRHRVVIRRVGDGWEMVFVRGG